MTSNRVVLGLDLGTTTGWGLLRSNGTRIASGFVKFDTKRGQGARWARYRRWLAERIEAAQEHGEVFVAYEKVRRHLGTEAAHAYGGFEAYTHDVCATLAIEPIECEVGTVKKRATGAGNADKAAMVLAARERWGYPAESRPGHEDEADALHVARLALESIA